MRQNHAKKNGAKPPAIPDKDSELLRMLSNAAVSSEPDDLTNRLVSKRLFDLSFLVEELGEQQGMRKLVTALLDTEPTSPVPIVDGTGAGIKPDATGRN